MSTMKDTAVCNRGSVVRFRNHASSGRLSTTPFGAQINSFVLVNELVVVTLSVLWQCVTDERGSLGYMLRMRRFGSLALLVLLLLAYYLRATVKIRANRCALTG